MSVIIDDQNPLVVQAGGTWFHSGSTNEFDSTTSVALSNGATLTYSFTGTQIGVFGTLDNTSGGLVATYAIDSGAPQSVSYASVPSPLYRQPFWVSDALTPAVHQLVVTVVNVNSNSSTPPKTGHIWFDYFDYLPVKAGTLPTTTSGTTTSSTSTTSTTSTTTTTSSSTSPTSSSTTTSSPATTSSTTTAAAATSSIGSGSANGATSQSNSGPNIGLIVGTSLAGALFVILCFAVALFFIRRTRRQRLEDLAAEYVAEDEEPKIMEPTQPHHILPGNVYPQNGGYSPYPRDSGTPFASSAALVPPMANNYGYPQPGGAPPGTPSRVPLMQGQGQGYAVQGYAPGGGGEQHFDPYDGVVGQQLPPPGIRLPSQMNLGPGSSIPSPPPNYYGNVARRQ